MFYFFQKHSLVIGSQAFNFNLSELIFNEIRLAANISGTSTEDILYYYKVLAKIMETCNFDIKGVDSSMKAKLIADLTTVQRKTKSSPRVQTKIKKIIKLSITRRYISKKIVLKKY